MVVAMSVSRKERVAKTDIKALEGIVKAGKFERQMDKSMLFTFTGDLPADAVRLRVVVPDDKTGNIGTSDLSAGETRIAKATDGLISRAFSNAHSLRDRWLPSLIRVLLLQFFRRRAPRALKSLRLIHQARRCLREFAFNAQQSLRRHQSPSHFQQMRGSRLQILCLSWIANPRP